MPIYEYACNACGHRLEIMQKINDPLASVCPACGASELRKLISRAGFQLKGGGWYVTDFRDNGKNKGKAAKSTEDGSAKTSDTAESKPAATSEPKAAAGDGKAS